jgi:hypothetical protein
MQYNYAKHECAFLPPQGVYIVSFSKKNPAWILTIQKEATEKDLEENHYLENIGDIIWQTELEITHCPYCGERLFGCDPKETKKYGKFRHIDSS